MGNEGDTDLSGALDQFDRVAANVVELERVWQQLCELTPSGIVFGADSPETENLVRSFIHIADHLPAIDGFRIDAVPLSQDEIAEMRFDAMDLGEPMAVTSVERGLGEPERQLTKYPCATSETWSIVHRWWSCGRKATLSHYSHGAPH
jgi:hypothetical protein